MMNLWLRSKWNQALSESRQESKVDSERWSTINLFIMKEAWLPLLLQPIASKISILPSKNFLKIKDHDLGHKHFNRLSHTSNYPLWLGQICSRVNVYDAIWDSPKNRASTYTLSRSVHYLQALTFILGTNPFFILNEQFETCSRKEHSSWKVRDITTLLTPLSVPSGAVP